VNGNAAKFLLDERGAEVGSEDEVRKLIL